jgi:hypothetical protein
MALLGKDDIVKAEDLVKEVVSVPEWRGEVTLRTMTAGDAMKISDLVQKDAKKPDKCAIAVMLSKVIEGANGELLFDSEDGAAALAKKSPKVLLRLWERAAKMNALGGKDGEELEKNSEKMPSEDSASD